MRHVPIETCEGMILTHSDKRKVLLEHIAKVYFKNLLAGQFALPTIYEKEKFISIYKYMLKLSFSYISTQRYKNSWLLPESAGASTF